MSTTDELIDGAEFRPSESPVRVREVLRATAGPVLPSLLEDCQIELGYDEIPVDRFLTQEWHDREMTHLWGRVWQFACRVEQIPEVGDHFVYDVGHLSALIVRTTPDEVQAYYNACLHRGMKLRTEGGHAATFRCPVHGFTWNLDGSLGRIPDQWDFPDLRPEEYGLPQLKVGIWEGFVFVNFDDAAPPLEDYLEILPEHSGPYALGDRYLYGHASKIVNCNWKVAQDAFLEGWHAQTTHPQGSRVFDHEMQYDIFGGQHISRLIQITGPSPVFRRTVTDEVLHEELQAAVPQPHRVDLADYGNAREAFAESMRRAITTKYRADFTTKTDSEMIDVVQYFVFPNFVPSMTMIAPLLFRFRPYGSDPGRCKVELMALRPKPEDGSEYHACQEFELAADQPWTDAPSFGPFAMAFEQDMSNVEGIQIGLRTLKSRKMMLSRYQESRLRHFNRTLERYLWGDDQAD